MSLLSSLFNKKKPQENVSAVKPAPANLSIDDTFVHYFLENGGKFLYNTSMEEVVGNFNKIIEKNNWGKVVVLEEGLKKMVKSDAVVSFSKMTAKLPFFTACEHLIADNGSVLFSSNQLKSIKLAELSENFIVFANTSQFVKNSDDALTSIKIRFRYNLPSNISPVKNYNLNNNDDNFLNHSSSNPKNLYLLLFEDL